MNRQVELTVSVPADAIQVPMVVVVYVRGKEERGLIVGGEQQVTVRDAEVHASVKLLQDPGAFDQHTLLLFVATAMKALQQAAQALNQAQHAQPKTVQ